MLWVGAGGEGVGRDVEGVGILEWGRSAASGWVPPCGVCLFPCCRGLAGVEFIKGTIFFYVKAKRCHCTYVPTHSTICTIYLSIRNGTPHTHCLTNCLYILCAVSHIAHTHTHGSELLRAHRPNRPSLFTQLPKWTLNLPMNSMRRLDSSLS
jgi:hypothetical protein